MIRRTMDDGCGSKMAEGHRHHQELIIIVRLAFIINADRSKIHSKTDITQPEAQALGRGQMARRLSGRQ
jgi:RNA polymerase subunit RPABC4/transcription elongation factor Spt4